MDLYLIPGLGADKRLFARMQPGGHALHHLEWPVMPEGSGLADFARVLARQVDADRPHALVGVSMGGMVAQELASITHPQKVVIVSSWKGPKEMPMPLRMLRGTHPERLLTKALLKRMLPVVRWQMGVEQPDDVVLFDQLVTAHSLDQLRVQVNACLAWDGPAAPVKDLVHIHGDHDRLMPIANIHGARVIAGGGHFMVHTMAEAVSAAVKQALTASA